MSRPVWVGVVLRMEDGSFETWQLDANDGPLRVSQGLTVYNSRSMPGNASVRLDLHIEGTAQPWTRNSQSAEIFPAPRALTQAEELDDER